MQFLITRSAVNLGRDHYLSSGEVGKIGNKEILLNGQKDWVKSVG